MEASPTKVIPRRRSCIMSKYRDPLSVKVDFLRHGTDLHSFHYCSATRLLDYVNPQQSNRHRHFIDSRMKMIARKANRILFSAQRIKSVRLISKRTPTSIVFWIPLHSQVRSFWSATYSPFSLSLALSYVFPLVQQLSRVQPDYQEMCRLTPAISRGCVESLTVLQTRPSNGLQLHLRSLELNGRRSSF